MLAQARHNLDSASVESPLLQADYRQLPWHCRGSFDAVVCLGAIGYLPDEAGFLQTFGNMRAVLRDGGILVSTVTLTDKQWAEKPRFILAANSGDFSRVYVIDYLERTARYNVLDIFHGAQHRGLADRCGPQVASHHLDREVRGTESRQDTDALHVLTTCPARWRSWPG
jgi:SAM-dependent methyltransferase